MHLTHFCHVESFHTKLILPELSGFVGLIQIKILANLIEVQILLANEIFLLFFLLFFFLLLCLSKPSGIDNKISERMDPPQKLNRLLN